jgi:membrane protease YdiL (CAAX protease family)
MSDIPKIDNTEPLIILFTMIVMFNIYWFISISEKISKKQTAKYGKEKASVVFGYTGKYSGVFLLGVIPALITLLFTDFSLKELGLNFNNFFYSLIWSVSISTILILVNLKSAKQPESIAYYPQIRKKEWNIGLLTGNSMAWTLYLLAYEFLFRGFLFMGLIPYFGLWGSLAVNTALYSATHIPKSMKEAVGAIPFGIILCLLTYNTGSIFIAFVVHVALALSNDYIALYHNPEMKIKFND